MKYLPRFILMMIAMLCLAGCTKAADTSAEPGIKAKLYFIDSSMMRLIPQEYYTKADTLNDAAQEIINQLITGHDENPKIRRIIPYKKNCLTVNVKGKIAYVNMTKEFIGEKYEGRDTEFLIVYQIVNSLTSVKGIVNVRFTIEGNEKKDFMGFIDMRETFIPNDYV